MGENAYVAAAFEPTTAHHFERTRNIFNGVAWGYVPWPMFFLRAASPFPSAFASFGHPVGVGPVGV